METTNYDPTQKQITHPLIPNLITNMNHNFYKTKICPHHAQGNCYKGPSCTFAHSLQELNSVPNLAKTKLCSNYSKGKCKYGEHCRFAHGESELMATADYYKTELCIQYVTGTCKYGPKCRFAHGSEELRPKLAPTSNVVKPFKSHKWLSDLKNIVPKVINIQKSVPLEGTGVQQLNMSALPSQDSHASGSETSCSWKDVYKPLYGVKYIDPFFDQKDYTKNGHDSRGHLFDDSDHNELL